jgi:hypothetical protein
MIKIKLDETYNIHKKINCIIPFFKSKFLCKKGIHNYRLNPKMSLISKTYTKDGQFFKQTKCIDETNLKCYCCGKEIKLE